VKRARPGQPNAAETAAIEERRLKVQVNLLAGLSLRQIAAAIGVSHETVRKDAKVIIGRWKAEQISARDELVALQSERYDEMLFAVYNAARQGDVKAIETVLKIEAARAKLFGTEAPTRHEQSGPDGGPLRHEHDLTAFAGDGARQLYDLLMALEADGGAS
jgi:hypothetical protein